MTEYKSVLKRHAVQNNTENDADKMRETLNEPYTKYFFSLNEVFQNDLELNKNLYAWNYQGFKAGWQAATAQPTSQEGFVLVPLEPTIPMLEQLFGGMMCGSFGVHDGVYQPALRKYKAMIDAAMKEYKK